MTYQALNRPVDVLAAERDARTIYDIACIREEQLGASREDAEFKAIALRNYRFCTAVAELIAAAKEKQRVTGGGPVVTVAEANAAYRRLDAALAAVETQP